MKKSFTINLSSGKGLIKKLMVVVVLLLFCLSPILAEPCGDVNFSGGVDIVDALMTAQFYVGLNPQPFNESAADVDGNGIVNIIDALQIAQYYVGITIVLNGCGPVKTPDQGCLPVTYELQAEEADWDDAAVESNHSGYTGSGFVNTANSAGRWIEWTFTISADSGAEGVFRYAHESGDRPMVLSVNGSNIATLNFSGSGAWNAWTTVSADFNLNAGSNTIRLTATSGTGAPNIDKMDLTVLCGLIVTQAPTSPPTPTPSSTPVPSGWTAPPRPSYLPKHWHETKGFGTNTKGGIAGTVYKVTNLNSSGSGSLRDAVSQSNRLVVFEVGGVIDLGGSRLSVGSNITIAGQTAPYPGITTIKGNFSISGSNIVISHISHHLGKAVSGHPDAMNVQGSNIVLDHVAVYWGKDETLPVAKSNNITLYKCLVAEGLQFTGHGDGEHSKGLHLQEGDSKISVIASLQAHSALRGPRLDGGEAFLANWVNYNWGPGWDHEGPSIYSDDELPGCTECFNYAVHAHMNANITLVGSVALWGSETKGQYFLSGHRGGTANAYLEDNIIKDRFGNNLYVSDSNIRVQNSPAIWPEGMVPLPADEALYEILRTAGPHPGNRTAHNARIVRDVANGTGEIIDSENEVGGYPDYPETRRLITVPNGAEARQAWLDALEDEIAVDTSIDLSRLYRIVGSRESDILAP